MVSRLLVFVSENTLWKSHEAVRDNLARAYRSGAGDRVRCTIKKVPAAGLPKSYWMRLARMSHQSGVRLDLVTLDGGLPYHTVVTWGKWLHPERTFFHFHVWSDVLFRQRELTDALTQLAGFQGALHVCSEAMGRLLRGWLGPATYHQHMIPLSALYFRATKAYQPRPDKKRVAYFGRINVDKGVADLVDWWRERRELCELRLYGAPSYEKELSWRPREFKKQQRRLETTIKKHAVPCVSLGSVNEVIKALKDSDIVVTCSTFLYEEFGLAVAEAIAAGRPVAISNWGGHTAFTSAPGICYLAVTNVPYPHVSFEELDRSLTALVATPARELKRRGSGNRRWAAKKLSIVQVGKQLSQSLREVSKLPLPVTHPTFNVDTIRTVFGDSLADESFRRKRGRALR